MKDGITNYKGVQIELCEGTYYVGNGGVCDLYEALSMDEAKLHIDNTIKSN